MNRFTRLLACGVGVLFFVAAAALYIYMHFFVGEGEDCNPFGFLPILQAGCHSTIAIWLMVVVVAAPGVVLWTWGRMGLEASAKPQDADDADTGEPVSDDEAAAEAQIVAQVQRTCQVAAMSAGNRDNPNEQRRFESRIEKALGLANGLRDEFYRSAAFHQIVSTLIKDKQLDRARELAREITVDMIQEKVGAELREAQAR